MKAARDVLLLAFLAALGLGVVFPNPHPQFWWNSLPVFDGGFGIAGALLLVFLAKLLGRMGLRKGEDYYD